MKLMTGKRSFGFKKSPLKICRKSVYLDTEICLNFVSAYVADTKVIRLQNNAQQNEHYQTLK
jgi:hypothetical protein